MDYLGHEVVGVPDDPAANDPSAGAAGRARARLPLKPRDLTEASRFSLAKPKRFLADRRCTPFPT
jgi:hypothetical protein